MAKAKPKILVVEDETFLVKIYANRLKKEGFASRVAMDGEEALRAVPEFKPDLVLLDIMLPKLNGFEVLQRLRADPRSKDLPVLVLSNLGQEGDMKRAAALGAIDYMVKANVSIQDVVARIRRALGKKT